LGSQHDSVSLPYASGLTTCAALKTQRRVIIIGHTSAFAGGIKKKFCYQVIQYLKKDIKY
jgi:hypothetical protein